MKQVIITVIDTVTKVPVHTVVEVSTESTAEEVYTFLDEHIGGRPSDR